jgi:hypothetical protein
MCILFVARIRSISRGKIEKWEVIWEDGLTCGIDKVEEEM